MLSRSKKNALIGGVCAGLARSLGVPIMLMRLVFLFGLLWATLTFWIYLILWLVMPVGAEMHFLDDLNNIRRQNGIVAGVCGGLGEYLGISAGILRLLWIVAIFFFGFGLIPYVILAICIPKKV